MSELYKEEEQVLNNLETAKTEIDTLNKTQEEEKRKTNALKKEVDEISRKLDSKIASKNEISLNFRESFTQLENLLSETTTLV